MTKISVMIPTFRRPEGVRRALASVLAQAGAPDFEVVVVDNAPEGGAAESVADLVADAAIPVRLVHEPKAGVASARNAGWAAARGRRIAFLDDDEEAPPHWLAALDRAAEATQADAVFGPIEAVLPESASPAHRRFLSDFFGRSGPDETCVTKTFWGCGNSLIDRERAGLPETPFSTAQDQLGGEDDLLFSGMEARGARFGWAADALAFEHVPASRANLRYALARSFAFGQGPAQLAAETKNPAKVAFWMGVGAGQTVVYGAAAGALWLVRSHGRGAMAGRAAQGLGKLFWFDAFAPRLYGGA